MVFFQRRTRSRPLAGGVHLTGMRRSLAWVMAPIAAKRSGDPVDGRRALIASRDRIDAALKPKFLATDGSRLHVDTVYVHGRRPKEAQPLGVVVASNANDVKVGRHVCVRYGFTCA